MTIKMTRPTGFRPRLLTLFLLSCLLSLAGCGKKHLEELQYDGEKFTDQGKPFSGRVYTFYGNSDRSADASAFYNFENGIPRGYWISYDPAGVITQYGRFRPYTDTALLHKLDTRLTRVNIYSFKQGPAYFSDVFLVFPKNALDSSVTGEPFRSSMLSRLFEHHLLDTSGGRTIHRIAVSESEFPSPASGKTPLP